MPGIPRGLTREAVSLGKKQPEINDGVGIDGTERRMFVVKNTFLFPLICSALFSPLAGLLSLQLLD